MSLLKGFTLPSGTLGRKMIDGALWTTGAFAYRYGLRLLSTVIVTRLLEPEAYGLMSLAMIVVTGLSLFSDIGIAPSVIRSTRGDEPDFLRTAWSLQILRGLFIGLMGCALAWPAAQIYDEPQLFLLIVALSLIPVLDGFKAISHLICTRRVELFRLSLIEIGAATVSTMLTIFFAWYLRSVWALAIGTLGGTFLTMVACYVFLPPFKHRFHFNRADVLEILTFGGWILLSTLVTFVGGRGLILLQGMLVPIDVLGFLVLADTIAGALGELAGIVLVKVFFPAISDVVRNRPHELASKVRRVQTVVYFGILPLFVLLSLVANPLASLIYDDRYVMVGDFLALMAINIGLNVMFMPYTNVILAKGGGRTHFKLMAVLAMVRILAVLTGFHVAGALGMVAAAGLGLGLYNFYLLRIAFKSGIGNPVRDIAMLLAIILFLFLMSAQVFGQLL